MAERWRAPVVPVAIETHESEGVMLADGRVLRQPLLALKQDDLDRLRSGYVCLKCFEPFERAWPERCHVCGAPVRKEQAAYFARELGPALRLGPTTSLSDEREALAERVEKEERDGS